MNQQAFESELKKEGYDVMTNTTPGAKVNPSIPIRSTSRRWC
jgi:hypothetical protein